MNIFQKMCAKYTVTIASSMFFHKLSEDFGTLIQIDSGEGDHTSFNGTSRYFSMLDAYVRVITHNIISLIMPPLLFPPLLLRIGGE